MDMINADTNLVDNNSPKGKLQDVIFGDVTEMKRENSPYVYVTTRSNHQKTSLAAGLSISDSLNQKTMEWNIVLVSYATDDTITSQSEMYGFLKSLDSMIQSNPTGLKPVTNDDPIFSRSSITAMPWDEETRGKEYSKITLILTGTIGSNLTVNFPTIGDVFILSQSGGPEGIVYGEDRMGDSERTLTDGGDFGSKRLEYESTFVLDELFRQKFGVIENITFKRGITSKIHKCKYIDITSTVQWDDIPRTVLHLEIVKS